MPMTKASLSTRLRGKLVLRSWLADDIALTQLCDDIAAAVVEEVQANATVAVNPLGLVAPSGGGLVTGAASGTVA